MRATLTRFSFAIALLFTTNLQAGIIFTENMAPGGNYSLDRLNPTVIPNLELGINRISGVIEGSGSPFQEPVDYDMLQITIPAGTALTGVYLQTYLTTDDYGFLAMNDTTFPYDGMGQFDPVDTSTFIGGTLFGPNGFQYVDGAPLDMPPVPLKNLMQFIGGGLNGNKIGTFSSLPAGNYAVLIQQLGEQTTYTMQFEVTAVPEPTSLALLLPAFALLTYRRRRT